MNTYRAVMLTKKGGLEVLETVELPLVEPGPGEVRVAVRATGAGGTDVTMRRGTYPYAPPIPFVPGYEVVGDVEAVGAGVTDLRAGQRVAALLVHGGYAEKVVRRAEEVRPGAGRRGRRRRGSADPQLRHRVPGHPPLGEGAGGPARPS